MGRRGRCFRVQVVDRYLRAAGRQEFDYRSSHPAGAARNQGNATVKITCHHWPPIH